MSNAVIAENGHKVATEDNSELVQVFAAGSNELIAETTGGHVLYEDGAVDRWYLPREDVRAKLVPSETTSHCPYKGDATYFSVELADGTILKDAVWTYEEPFEAATEVEDEVSFWTDQLRIEVGGHPSPK